MLKVYKDVMYTTKGLKIQCEYCGVLLGTYTDWLTERKIRREHGCYRDDTGIQNLQIEADFKAGKI